MFKYLIGLSALTITVMAAFFSVSGLALLFSGAFLSVAIAMSCLEFSKLIITSFLYRYWRFVSKIFKFYLIFGLLILMLITSIGIFGYLTNAYQNTSIILDKTLQQKNNFNNKKDRLENEKKIIIQEKNNFVKILNSELSAITINNSTKYLDSKWRSRIMKRYHPLIDEKEKKINKITLDLKNIYEEITKLEIKEIESGIDIGPIIFVARLFNSPIDEIVKYLILVIIFIFDPMAISLVIAYNITIKNNKKLDENKKSFLANNNNINNIQKKVEIDIENKNDNTIKKRKDKKKKKATLQEVLDEQLNYEQKKKIVLGDKRVP